MTADWQPIASAPKNGTEILVFMEDAGGWMDIAFWYDNGLYAHWRDSQAEPLEPAFWMPLPDPPQTELPDQFAARLGNDPQTYTLTRAQFEPLSISLRYRVQGEHVQCRVMTAQPTDANYVSAGRLLFRAEEWDAVQATMVRAGIVVSEDDTVPDPPQTESEAAHVGSGRRLADVFINSELSLCGCGHKMSDHHVGCACVAVSDLWCYECKRHCVRGLPG